MTCLIDSIVCQRALLLFVPKHGVSKKVNYFVCAYDLLHPNMILAKEANQSGHKCDIDIGVVTLLLLRTRLTAGCSSGCPWGFFTHACNGQAARWAFSSFPKVKPPT